MRPNDFVANAYAARSLTIFGPVRAQAKRYALRAAELATGETDKNYPALAAWTRLFPAHESWLDGDLEEAERTVSLLAATLKTRTGREQKEWTTEVGIAYLALGRLKQAETYFQTAADRITRGMLLANAAVAREDWEAVAEHLRGSIDYPSSAILLTRAGRLPEAQKMIQCIREKKLIGHDFYLKVMEGELALARGQTAQAISLLEEGLRAGEPWAGTTTFFLGSESLARVREQRGDLEEALQVLEKASQFKRRTNPTWDKL